MRLFDKSGSEPSKRRLIWYALTLLSLALLQQKVSADVKPFASQELADPNCLQDETQHSATPQASEGDAETALESSENQFHATKESDRFQSKEREEQLPISAPTSRPGRTARNEILIVSSVDGTLAGISKATGEVLWKRQGAGSSNKGGEGEQESEAPPLLEPLVSTSTTIHSTSKVGPEHDWRTTAVPSIDGSVLLTAKASAYGGTESVHDNQNEDNGQVTLTTSLLELAKRAPFVDNRGRVYSSQHRSMTFALDGETGEILRQIPNTAKMASSSSSSTWSQQQNQPTWKDRLVVWLGRMDRSVSIHEPRSGALDVEVGAAQILSINDMAVAKSMGEENKKGDRTASQYSSLLLEGTCISGIGGSVVTTPSGNLAWREEESGSIVWVSNERFDAPVAYAIDAQSGNSVKVSLVPDAATPQGTQEYLSKELLRQYNLVTSDDENKVGSMELAADEHTIVGSLPNGQLYALPLGSRRGRGSQHHNPTHSLPAAAASTAELRAASSVSSGGTSRTHHHSSYQHISGDRKGGKPLLKRNCQPGATQFPGCLLTGRHESLDSFTHHTGGHLLSGAAAQFGEDHVQDGAVVPFFHAEYGDVPPHQYFFISDEERNRRKFQKFLRVMGSWLAPVIALLFVVSFEMGRRKRQQEKDKLGLKTADVASVQSLPLSPPETGVIKVFDDVILGYGGHGTVVFKGSLEGRQVAVKRMLKAYHGSADREISLLIESDGHPNVVRYFLKEVRGDFVYLALELCDLSLHDLIGQIRSVSENLVADKDCLIKSVPDATRGILFQIAQGVKHLHGLRIVHRDLKPANILLAYKQDKRNIPSSSLPTRDGSVCDNFVYGHYVAKISDMGLGKQIIGQSSYGGSTLGDASLRGQSNGGQSSIAGAGPGSVGWQAPEVMALRLPSDVSMKSDDSLQINDSLLEGSPTDIAATARTSRSVDIFSLGCIFYATLVPGSHPFGEWYEREVNIMHHRPNMDVLKKQSPDAYDLVASMIQRVPSDRPTARQVCEHPYFWSLDRRLAFLCDVSDRIESESTSTDGKLPQSFVAKLLAIERRASEVTGTAWDVVLDETLINNVQRFRTYDPSSVRDLLRLIRNKHHHYDELPEILKAKMGSNTAGLMKYFESKFPMLLIHCYNAFRKILSEDDPLSTKYSITPLSRKGAKVSCADVSTIPEATELTGGVLEDAQDIEEPTRVEVGAVESDHEDGPGVENERGDYTVATKSTPNANQTNVVCDLVHTQKKTVDESIGAEAVEANPEDIIVWECSAAAKTFRNRGWSRSDDEWIRRSDAALLKPNSNLVRCAEDPKFRTRLCNHWDVSLGTFCPMRKKNKCVFAHGPVELRVKEGKRNRWGKLVDKNGENKNPKHSGGEDTYGAARSIEVERQQEGKWNVNGLHSKGGKKNTQRKKEGGGDASRS